MKFKLAILTFLAECPGGRATLDEIRRDIGPTIASVHQTERLKRFSKLGDIDLFRSGLVLPDDTGLQITDAGLSLLNSLEGPASPPLDVDLAPTSQSLKLIDDLVGAEERLKIFDLELRTRGETADSGSLQEEPGDGPAEAGTPALSLEADPNCQSEIDTPDAAQEIDHLDRDNSRHYETIATDPTNLEAPDAPALMRSFGSGIHGFARTPSRRSIVSALIVARIRQALGIWRRHLERDEPNAKTGRRTGSIGGGVFALLTLLVIVLCAGAVASLTEIRSLRSEIALLQRELFPLKERLAMIDQAEKMKRDLEQEAESKASESGKTLSESRVERVSLNLSREEVQLIREYIKPAPFTGSAAPAINVGDPFSGGTIPLPSSLTDKIPKLLGARFAIHDGAIIIVKKDSRQADAVLPPY